MVAYENIANNAGREFSDLKELLIKFASHDLGLTEELLRKHSRMVKEGLNDAL